MSTRNLDALFKPASVALIGASNRPGSVGAVVAANLVSAGFANPILPVNPHEASIAGLRAYPDVKSLPLTPDLAIICTPAGTVPGLIEELAARGTRGAIVISAGFRELGTAQAAQLQQHMVEAAGRALLRIVGPNCIGVLSASARLNASFAHLTPKAGRLAFVAQSGAMLTAVLDWANARGVGFSKMVSLGDMADVDFGDVLDYLALDPETEAILLYVEAITDARKFMSAARIASRLKPVIVIKAGRHAQAAKAALSHTGALAGADDVYDAAFRRAGILRVRTLDELFDAVETLATARPLSGERLAILTNGGGLGVLATDALLDLDGSLAALSPPTLASLDSVLPPTWSHGNPVDIIGDAPPKRYEDALAALLSAQEVDAVLALNCPTAVASSDDAAAAVVKIAQSASKLILTNWLGAGGSARAQFTTAGIPTFDTPDEAVRGYMNLVCYRRAQDALMEVPPSVPEEFRADTQAAAHIVKSALAGDQTWLEPQDVFALLSCYEIPGARSILAASEKDAGAAAQSFAHPVALKIQSPEITHKSDVGGVMLNVPPAEVAAAAARMRTQVLKAKPGANIEGFLLQEMIVRPGATELILGMTVDATFGPVMLFGQGGVAVEVIGDKSLALPPLNLALARRAISETRVFRALKAYRNRPAADMDAIALTFVKLAQLCCDLEDIVEIDINPLLADENGVIAVDARIRLGSRAAGLAIMPYPGELEREETIAGMGHALLRPIRPEDAPSLRALLAQLKPEDARSRFFAPSATPPALLLARLTQLDYDREMAFLLQTENGLAGVLRLSCDPNYESAEFAILVPGEMQRRGIGSLMLDRLIAYARGRGLGELFGYVQSGNEAMIGLCRRLGFTVPAARPEDAGFVRATLVLNSTAFRKPLTRLLRRKRRSDREEVRDGEPARR